MFSDKENLERNESLLLEGGGDEGVGVVGEEVNGVGWWGRDRGREVGAMGNDDAVTRGWVDGDEGYEAVELKEEEEEVVVAATTAAAAAAAAAAIAVVEEEDEVETNEDVL